MKEIYHGRYSLDEQGNVYSNFNHAGNRRNIPKRMVTEVTRGGYLSLKLWVNSGNGFTYICVSVHRLIATAYIDNPDTKPEVNHINGDKLDNRVSNLEWVTKSENSLHAFTTGLRTPNKGGTGRFNELHANSLPIHAIDCKGVIALRFPSMKEAGRAGFSQGNISMVINGTRKTHKGYRWALT